jgi:hypothetical protein
MAAIDMYPLHRELRVRHALVNHIVKVHGRDLRVILCCLFVPDAIYIDDIMKVYRMHCRFFCDLQDFLWCMCMAFKILVASDDRTTYVINVENEANLVSFVSYLERTLDYDE